MLYSFAFASGFLRTRNCSLQISVQWLNTENLEHGGKMGGFKFGHKAKGVSVFLS